MSVTLINEDPIHHKSEAKKMMKSLLKNGIVTVALAALFFYSIYVCVHQGNFLTQLSAAALGMSGVFYLRMTVLDSVSRKRLMEENQLENDSETLYLPADMWEETKTHISTAMEWVLPKPPTPGGDL